MGRLSYSHFICQRIRFVFNVRVVDCVTYVWILHVARIRKMPRLLRRNLLLNINGC